VLVAVAAVNVVGWERLSQSSAPLAVVAKTVLGPKAELLMTAIALASTANTVLLMLLAASRAMWAMSCAGVLPGTFCVIGENRHTPWKTILVVGVVSGLFVLMGDIGRVADMTNFAVLLAFAAVNASALKLFRDDDKQQPLKRLIKNIFLPCLGILVSLLLAATTGWRAALLGAGLLAAGVVVRRLMVRNTNSKAG
jgi:APA family basic amino acid/polyamine antiporter